MFYLIQVTVLGTLMGCSPPKNAGRDTGASSTDSAVESHDSGSSDTSPPPDTGQPPGDGDDTGALPVPIEGLTFEMVDPTVAMHCEESWTNPSLSGAARLDLTSARTDNIALQLSAALQLTKDGIDGEESTILQMAPSEREVEHRTEVRLPVTLAASDTALSRGCNWCGGNYALTITVTDADGAALSDTAEGTLECTP